MPSDWSWWLIVIVVKENIWMYYAYLFEAMLTDLHFPRNHFHRFRLIGDETNTEPQQTDRTKSARAYNIRRCAL